MKPSLETWIGDADALVHQRHFNVVQSAIDYAHISNRLSDYYIALVGELFSRLAQSELNPADWPRLGNALWQISSDAMRAQAKAHGISKYDAVLFAAAAYYCGGYPASAYLTARSIADEPMEGELPLACYDMLARPVALRSQIVPALLSAVRDGNLEMLDKYASTVSDRANASLLVGPNDWIHARILQRLIARFLSTNLRSVLPAGANPFWTPLVVSLLDRPRSTWEFFPSQIEAIQRGLLESQDGFALQMPTGSGKTTLCETLLYAHAMRNPTSASILIVPYRSLASELRESLVKQLNKMGINARCAYGGTVPSGDEVQQLKDTRILVATPEALSGLLSADQEFLRRISLVICDEGHLLDQSGRGVALELLLARLKARTDGAPRFVFISAIVPNIEEISAWLGGTNNTVVKSDYRPAAAEFALLREMKSTAATSVSLVLHPHEAAPTQYSISNFIAREDFVYRNPASGRSKTYQFSSIKTRAIAAARKALAMGAVAVFATNKRGAQGCLGLAEELLSQLEFPLNLPDPRAYVQQERVGGVQAYLEAEFGAGWRVTAALRAGTVVHHGDIPQETRELLEQLLRGGDVQLAICTNTLAEGVNLPIRTLVLYSVQRVLPDGKRKPLLARDIKNLVGRAGRAGSNTKGLVICANEADWRYVSTVATHAEGEKVKGALRDLMSRLSGALARNNRSATNELLESLAPVYPVLDGIDMTLLDLAAEELGQAELTQIATRLADETFASSQATEESSRVLLRTVFALRAERVAALKNAGRLEWIRSTGACMRLIDSVEKKLFPSRSSWADFLSPTDPDLLRLLLAWAWTSNDVNSHVRDAFGLKPDENIEPAQTILSLVVAMWMDGRSFADLATSSGLPIDDLLAVHTAVVTFSLQTLLEQGVALLDKVVTSKAGVLSPAVTAFPNHLRFGVPTRLGCILAARGVRHRRAYVQLGTALQGAGISAMNESVVLASAADSLRTYEEQWRSVLGNVVFDNTRTDLERYA